MKGDFSKIHFFPHDNFNGILPQQGKVLLDSEGVAQTLIENDWHETAARDWVGPIAGVPSGAADSFKVSAASLSGGTVSLTVSTGHIWADGLLVRLGDGAASTETRTATWLEPPIVPTAVSAGDVAAGTQDAVVLEVWQHAVNGYQMPDKLIEPALGGPDTSERLKTSYAFRLARLATGGTCADVTFDESGRGALTVSLVPPIVTGGDCPVEGSGGYSGFEHQFYRIEIANTNGGASQFKWSRVNGGLVGRGSFDPSTQKIAITAALAAITSYGQPSFYLEVEAYDASLGYSQVVAGATATLSGNTLQCAATPIFGTYPAATSNTFFRLWDGLSPVASYPLSATPGQLENGILLQFDADAVGKYFPGDYWTFPVRAQGIANPQTLINAKQPQGIVYHRVPLAEITWASSGGGAFTAGTIEDCRTIVPPLSRTKGCCTCRVGDGVESFGDFPTIQAAVDALPPQGGEICLLPGRYYENLRILNRRDIVIHGCGWDTRVASKSLAPGGSSTGSTPNPLHAVFTIAGCEHIELRSFAIEAADDEVGILIDGDGASVSAIQPGVYARAAAVSVAKLAIDITVKDMVLTAAQVPAILAARVQLLTIERNRIAMKNMRSTWPAVFASGREIHIENNWVGIQSLATLREWLPLSVVNDLEPKTSTSLASSLSSGTDAAGKTIAAFGLTLAESKVSIHPGGIQIGGPSTDVYILENEIEGGSHNGVTLGSLIVVEDNGDDTGTWTGVSVDGGDDCCTGTLQPPRPTPGTPGTTVISAGILTNIHIHRNRIRSMGLCGIGPAAMFDLVELLEIISIFGLNISQNEINLTVLRDLAVVSKQASTSIGYGAICIPDVTNLIVRDNTIADFGAQPGVRVCGILVIHGEQLEISRNRVLETRDWTKATVAATGSEGACGGIIILQATPPTVTQASAAYLSASAVQQNPTYEPGVPAVRVEHNLVRVPLAYALAITGLGPMTIVNNHLSCGGYVRTPTKALAQTVLILNLGTAIDSAAASASPSNLFHGTVSTSVSVPPNSNGTVLFSNNVCQLEARASRQTETSSITIFTADHLIFTNNECWLDAPRSTAAWNALLLATTLNVVANRFQETLYAVQYSGLTSGKVNVTGQNISTYCLLAFGAKLANNNNLVLVPNNCDDLQKRLGAELGLSQ